MMRSLVHAHNRQEGCSGVVFPAAFITRRSQDMFYMCDCVWQEDKCDSRLWMHLTCINDSHNVGIKKKKKKSKCRMWNQTFLSSGQFVRYPLATGQIGAGVVSPLSLTCLPNCDRWTCHGKALREAVQWTAGSWSDYWYLLFCSVLWLLLGDLCCLQLLCLCQFCKVRELMIQQFW